MQKYDNENYIIGHILRNKQIINQNLKIKSDQKNLDPIHEMLHF